MDGKSLSEQIILDAIKELSRKQEEDFRRMEKKNEEGFQRLEQRINKTDSDIGAANNKQTQIERDVYHYHNEFIAFKNEYAEDKKNIYANMGKTAKEAVKDTKIWIYGGIGAGLIMLAGLVEKIK